MEETDTSTSKNKAIITFAAVLMMAVIVVAAVAASPKKRAATTAAANNGAAAAPTAAGDASASTDFKDGSYTATGSYESPGGNEHITVHVTLSGGTVTASSADSGAGDPEAHEYQSMFIGGYKSQVVGKHIADVHLSRVSGSSLTSQGFNDAIDQIENQARA